MLPVDNPDLFLLTVNPLYPLDFTEGFLELTPTSHRKMLLKYPGLFYCFYYKGVRYKVQKRDPYIPEKFVVKDLSGNIEDSPALKANILSTMSDADKAKILVENHGFTTILKGSQYSVHSAEEF